MLVCHAGLVIGVGVSGVDFNQVMYYQHLKHSEYVEVGGVGVLGKEQYQKAEMPGVFGIVLLPTAVDQEGLTEDFLQLVGFHEKVDLAIQAVELLR